MEAIDVFTETPRSRSEYYLFETIKKITERQAHYEIFGNSVMSSNDPSPDSPCTITNVIYNETRTGRGTVLRGVGSYKDKIVVDGATRTAYVERNIGVVELDGTEAGWFEYNPAGAGHGLSFTLPVTSKIGYALSICTHFKNIFGSWDTQYANRTGIYTDHYVDYNKFFRKPNESIDTLAKFKDWLAEQKAAGTPVQLYYPLLQTVTEQIEYIGI